VRDAARALAYFAPVSTDTQALLADLLAVRGWVDVFLEVNATRLAASARAAAGRLAYHGIGCVPARAGLSLWTDLRGRLAEPTFEAETALWQHISQTARVNVLPGRVFGAAEPGWFRVCHAVDPRHVAAGIDRIAAATDAVAAAGSRRSA
jgi:1-aminocyclopropane-1-carboxylate synthase 1/2/6